MIDDIDTSGPVIQALVDLIRQESTINEGVINSEIQHFIDVGEYGEAVTQAAAFLEDEQIVSPALEGALWDASQQVDEDVSEYYTWRRDHG